MATTSKLGKSQSKAGAFNSTVRRKRAMLPFGSCAWVAVRIVIAVAILVPACGMLGCGHNVEFMKDRIRIDKFEVVGEHAKNLRELQLKDYLFLIYDRWNATQPFWAFAFTVWLSLLAFMGTEFGRNLSKQERALLVAGLWVFAFANLFAIWHTTNQRDILVGLAKKLHWSERRKRFGTRRRGDARTSPDWRCDSDSGDNRTEYRDAIV